MSRFQRMVDEARSRIRETSVEEIHRRMENGDRFYLIDVREESEWARGRIPGANRLGKGVIERDIERAIPDPAEEIVLYCGGGHRSALAADALQRMGYTNVWSMAGGIGEWFRSGLPLEQE
ncbi:MAG TPA: rhodanese-like domain-containing protein [Gemmatimonadota bacterium]|nr:rhodanese-like domain-containing protein [Gemmatimonadota bacterium]